MQSIPSYFWRVFLLFIIAAIPMVGMADSEQTQQQASQEYRDSKGEPPYIIGLIYGEGWSYGLFGDPSIRYVSISSEILEYFKDLDQVIQKSFFPDSTKYFEGVRNDYCYDNYPYSVRFSGCGFPSITLGCVENKRYQPEISLSEGDNTQAFRNCEETLKKVAADLTQKGGEYHWIVDYETFTNNESAIFEAIQDVAADIQFVVSANNVTNWTTQDHYRWQIVATEGTLKVVGGAFDILLTAPRLAYGVTKTAIGLLSLPTEERGHLGETARRGLGFTAKSTLDPVVGTISIADGLAGFVIYAGATATSPIIVLTKEGIAQVRELSGKTDE